MTQQSHTACKIFVNTPITFAYQNLWGMLFQQSAWTQGTNIQKKSGDLVKRNITLGDIDAKQVIKKQIKQKKISVQNASGNLGGKYAYQFQQNGKGEVILNYISDATLNNLAWPSKIQIEEELLEIKNQLQWKHHGPKAKKAGFCG